MSKRVSHFPILVLFLLFALSLTNSTKLSISLIPSRTFCFNEDLPKHSLVKLEVSSGDQPFRLQLIYQQQLLENITSSKTMLKSFTTQKFGIYRFCLTNQASRFNTLVFSFLTGVQAKDYGSHTQSSDYLASLDNQANIAQMFINQIKQENKEGLEVMYKDSVVYHKFSIQYFFTIVFVGVILLLSYLQFVYVRNYMISRKYI